LAAHQDITYEPAGCADARRVLREHGADFDEKYLNGTNRCLTTAQFGQGTP
jgi:hypothetical protein